MDSLLFTIEEARAEIKCSRSFIYQEIKSGHIRILKLGRASRIRSTELRRYVEDKVAQSESNLYSSASMRVDPADR